jgi:hypothetical protein
MEGLERRFGRSLIAAHSRWLHLVQPAFSKGPPPLYSGRLYQDRPFPHLIGVVRDFDRVLDLSPLLNTPTELSRQ